jgi:hypothetical protein
MFKRESQLKISSPNQTPPFQGSNNQNINPKMNISFSGIKQPKYDEKHIEKCKVRK